MQIEEQEPDLESELEQIINNTDAQLICIYQTKNWWKNEVRKLRLMAYSDYAHIILNPLKQEGL